MTNTNPDLGMGQVSDRVSNDHVDHVPNEQKRGFIGW